MDKSLLLKSAAVQLLLVGVLSLILGLLLPHSFFEHWGWFSGPLAWVLCAAGTARFLSLPIPRTVLGSILVGLPSIIAVIVGVHLLGVVLAVVLFAVWCAYSPSAGQDSGEPYR